MDAPADHEHFFATHQDPRWLICDCGQFAVWTRNTFGEPSLRLIDTPKPCFSTAITPDRFPPSGQCPAGNGSQREQDPALASVQMRT